MARSPAPCGGNRLVRITNGCNLTFTVRETSPAGAHRCSWPSPDFVAGWSSPAVQTIAAGDGNVLRVEEAQSAPVTGYFFWVDRQESSKGPYPRRRFMERAHQEHEDPAGMPDVYTELREVACRYLSRERKGHTLQPTALVHEAFLRLRQHKAAQGMDRGELMRLAARTMRHVLVDHARRRNAQKRGGASQRVALDDAVAVYHERAIDLIALHEVLERLESVDPRMTRIVEFRFFAGLTEEETAETLSVSTSTVRREWRLARHRQGRLADGSIRR